MSAARRASIDFDEWVAMVRAGNALAVIAHNWSQCPGKTLSNAECMLLRERQRAWDAAYAAASKNGALS